VATDERTPHNGGGLRFVESDGRSITVWWHCRGPALHRDANSHRGIALSTVSKENRCKPRRFKTGTCIHCGVPSEELTGDHVFPESWYPDSTPLDLEKWQAPSCKSCNEGYGRLERTLFLKLAMGLEPWTVGAEGIAERALRSFDPRTAKNENDRKHREGAREKVRRSIVNVSAVSFTEPILPNIGTIHSSGDQGYSIEIVPQADLHRLIGKFVRGISYLATGGVLAPEYVIRVIPLMHSDRLPQHLLESPATVFERGPGFRVERHGTCDDRFAALFRIQFWGRYEFFATVWLAELEKSGAMAG